MKNFFYHTYLARLYRFSRPLFIMVTGFFLFTVLANVLKAQAVPFFVWGMYSEKMTIKQEHRVLEVIVNDSVMDFTAGYPDATRFFLGNPLGAYATMKGNNDVDKAIAGYPGRLKEHFLFYRKWVERTVNRPERYRECLAWYARYFREVTGTAARSLELKWVYCHYDRENRLQMDSSQTVNTSLF